MRIKILALFFFTVILINAMGFMILYKEEPKKQFDLSTQNIHAVRCMDEEGNLETYHINVPSEVQDLEAFSSGFCKSLK